ncbi:phosphotransferase enzyme family protein [Ruegeria arenilitoris]|uniref:phosphotransferase enzyme family protein n=1 Tax=Ruegeria arenilitoris TaxID=1173585 RepID=UPI0014802957|nr:homoserine kinase [Ruegeria arenilitoris]
MKEIVEQALVQWGMEDAEWSLVAARENHVYRVRNGTASYALRLHREGLHSAAELWSELQWMSAAAADGVSVPSPVATKNGEFLIEVDGIHVDLLDWLPGRPLGATGARLETENQTATFKAIGREMARLHKISDAWTPPKNFTRWSWDCAGLLGDEPLWGRFWENPTINGEDRALLLRFRDKADHELLRLESSLDYGLIHADLVRENVIVDGDKIRLIDFDDSGYGFRLFDVATTLIKNREEPDFAQLRDALLEGYRSERPINTDQLDLFMTLRATSYVGWISSRLDEEGSSDRNTRFLETARELLTEYLD